MGYLQGIYLEVPPAGSNLLHACCKSPCRLSTLLLRTYVSLVPCLPSLPISAQGVLWFRRHERACCFLSVWRAPYEQVDMLRPCWSETILFN